MTDAPRRVKYADDRFWKQLFADAQARYDAMTPEQQKSMWEAQRQSWLRGMAPCEHGVRDFEQCPDCRKTAP